MPKRTRFSIATAVALSVTVALSAAACGSSETPTGAPGSTTAAPGTAATPPGSSATNGTTAGAGGSDGTSPSSTMATSSTTVGGPESSSTTRSANASTSSTPVTSGVSTTVEVATSDQAFCAAVLEGQAALAALDPADNEAAALVGFKDVLSSLAAVAPAGIKADVDVINAVAQAATTWTQLVDAGTPEVRAASDRVDAWTNAHCGTTLAS